MVSEESGGLANDWQEEQVNGCFLMIKHVLIISLSVLLRGMFGCV